MQKNPTMTICRTCLRTPAKKDLLELERELNEDNKNYLDIMLFCLDIKVNEDSHITMNLCYTCYKKIISFYKFKEQCLKNDAYLKSVDPESLSKGQNAVYVTENDIKHENCTDSDEFDSQVDEVILLKQELDLKEEDDLQSDDELLSVIQKVKYEAVAEETKENTVIPKKRGRPKTVKLENSENNSRRVCDECGKSVRNLKEHLQCHQPKAERQKLQCKVCPKMFSTYSARYRHHKTKHLGVKKQCEICKKQVVCLKQHRLVMHDAAALPFGCVPCGRRFISQSALLLHMSTHTKDRPHECDVCQKKFRAKLHLELHVRQVHNKEKPHMCQFCSKTFFKKYHLQVHLRSHTKEKPYECVDCGKFFTSTTTLKNHRLIHSEEKMFHCQLCTASFSKPGYLKNHMISHTKERRHPCKYCGLRFGRSDHRKRHEFTAHEKHVVVA